MKSLKLIFAATILFTTITACKKGLFGFVKGKGETVTEERAITDFNKIQLSIDADITYVQDADYYVEITAQPNILAVITTKVSAGELKFDTKKNIRHYKPIKIVVHSPQIKGLDISGSGNITSQHEIVTNYMDLHISGSGNISINSLVTEELESSISGSGNITIDAGTAQNQAAKISGSGDIYTRGLTAGNVSARISGSGNITIWAVQQLDATISGSGDIRYKGQPIVNTHISGSGSVIHL